MQNISEASELNEEKMSKKDPKSNANCWDKILDKSRQKVTKWAKDKGMDPKVQYMQQQQTCKKEKNRNLSQEMSYPSLN